MEIFLFIIGILILILLIYSFVQKNKREQVAKKMLSNTNDFVQTKSFSDAEGKCYFGYDQEHKKVLISRVTTDNTIKRMVENFYVTSSHLNKNNTGVVFLDNENKRLLVSSIPTLLNDKINLDVFDDFQKTSGIFDSDNGYGMFVDQNSRQIIIIQWENFSTKKIRFEDIISVNIIEDGDITFQKSTLRTIGGGLVGGLLVGSAGAVVGGLSGNSKQKKIISSVLIKLMIRDIESPAYTITCISGKKLKTDDLAYTSLIKKATEVKDLLSVIIDQVDNEYRQSNQPHVKTQTESVSIADELKKIAELRDSGILTESEFQDQKKKLLNR